MKTINVPFEYYVYTLDTQKHLATGKFIMPLDEKDVRYAADIIQKNEGFLVNMQDLYELYDKICEEAFTDFEINQATEDIDWDNVSWDLQSDIPQVFLDEINRFVKEVGVDICFYYLRNGKEESVFVHGLVPADTFDLMVELAQTPHEGMTDFELLKEKDDVAHHRIIYDFMEKAAQQMPADADRMDPYLKDFPFQVYESI